LKYLYSKDGILRCTVRLSVRLTEAELAAAKLYAKSYTSEGLPLRDYLACLIRESLVNERISRGEAGDYQSDPDETKPAMFPEETNELDEKGGAE